MTRSLTSILFHAARLSADGRALRKGPEAVGKRIIRKQVYRRTGGILGALLRAVLK
ncbi:hypothetical protein ACFFGR_09270 [Arthrobacter liuii]|uniref:Uncharacterized protein n=1 Tax=Arthrobacter liuii TaxID=1476996 RepID=A0ABQ2AMG1_9MICC|nr:hypothetical protein [Arthrobacter liuii]GGH93805.1 hypothetical protein GCM10007170_15530 [Arthrobacter liuii]